MSVKNSTTKASVLTWEEAEKIYQLSYIRKDYNVSIACVCGCYYGLGAGSMFSLTWEDVLQNDYMEVELKGGRPTHVKIIPEAKAKLKDIWGQLDYPPIQEQLFCTKKGPGISMQRLNRLLKYYHYVCGDNVTNLTSESFKKTFGRFIYDSMPLAVRPSVLESLAKFYNHSSTTFTKEYLDIIETNELDLVNIGELFEIASKMHGDVEVDIPEPLIEAAKMSYVYIMVDSAIPGIVKIGKTNNLTTRERTLQGQKPTISLYKYIAVGDEASTYKFESALHRKYKDYRVRGEWFRLPEYELKTLLCLYDWCDAKQFLIR